jgi:hypothetical protein
MDQNRLKRICEKALDMSYKGLIISEFRSLPTQKFDQEKNEWVPDSQTLFIMLKKTPDFINDTSGYRTVENFLESLLGFECCIDFV